MSYSKNKKRSNNKTLIILSVTAALIAAGLIVLFLEKSGRINLYQSDTKPQQTSQSDQNKINYDPPTKQEAESGNEQKENLPDQNQEPQKPNTANIVIVDANQYDQEIEVRAFVSNAVKDGTCEIVFEKGSQKITKTVNAYADASTTPCMNVVVPRSEFPESGTWKLTVTYESTDLTGINESTLEIQ